MIKLLLHCTEFNPHKQAQEYNGGKVSKGKKQNLRLARAMIWAGNHCLIGTWMVWAGLK